MRGGRNESQAAFVCRGLLVCRDVARYRRDSRYSCRSRLVGRGELDHRDGGRRASERDRKEPLRFHQLGLRDGGRWRKRRQQRRRGRRSERIRDHDNNRRLGKRLERTRTRRAAPGVLAACLPPPASAAMAARRQRPPSRPRPAPRGPSPPPRPRPAAPGELNSSGRAGETAAMRPLQLSRWAAAVRSTCRPAQSAAPAAQWEARADQPGCRTAGRVRLSSANPPLARSLFKDRRRGEMPTTRLAFL